jgi:3-hydroxyacyl-CoA dehydrogenase
MSREIKKVAVIGAGVMGMGIAAQMANAGLEVELLDIVPKEAHNRNMIAEGALEKALKTNPAPFMHKDNARKIRAGNTEDHLERLKDCDLIIEAVKEDVAIKAALFQKIDQHRKAGSVVASNTSTIPLAVLTAEQSAQFKKDFVITHFFNPPRYMRLLELVTSNDNDPAMVAMVKDFMDQKIGKGVVLCHDSPGFIANRIGTFWLETAVVEAYRRDVKIEEADALLAKPIGVPKTGVFGLIDLVGLDLMPHISKSLLARVPADDPYRKVSGAEPVLTDTLNRLMAEGFTGRKGKGGFYRLNPESKGDEKEKQTLDLKTGTYRKSIKKPKLKALEISKKKGLKALMQDESKEGRYVREVMIRTLHYTASLVPAMVDDIHAVDEAMRLGYGWSFGPFELLDKIGTDDAAKAMADLGLDVPPLLQKAQGKSFYSIKDGQKLFLDVAGNYQPMPAQAGVLLLADIKRKTKPVIKNKSAAVWDIGDGVLCLEFTSKMNSLDHKIMDAINETIKLIGDGKGQYKALVIHNEADDFSVGANLGLALIAAMTKQYWLIDKIVQKGQDTLKALKYAPFPVVAAPSGKALGGGCEVLLHSNKVVAHAETYMGLVEVGVGLIPGWGGCAEMTVRAQASKKLPKGPMPAVAHCFEALSTAKVALSAQEGKEIMYLNQDDVIVMNKARLLFTAKETALLMAKDFVPPAPAEQLLLPGPAGKEALRLAVDGAYLRGLATPYDVVVSDRLATVLTGGDKADVTVRLHEDEVRRLEREEFKKLARDHRTFARIKHILTKGKPLREKPDGSAVRDLRLEKAGLWQRAVEFFVGAKPSSKDDFKAAAPKACCAGGKPAPGPDAGQKGDAPKKAA